MLVITVVIMHSSGFLYLNVHACTDTCLGITKQGRDQEAGVSKCRPVSMPEGQHTNDMCSAVADKEPWGKSL